MIITENGPQIIEVTPRLHGPTATLHLIPNASGLNPVAALIQVISGEKLSPVFTTPSKKLVGIYKYLLVPPGKILSIKGLNQARKIPGVRIIHQFKSIGEKINYRNSSDVPISFVVVNDSLKKVTQLEQLVEKTIKVKLAS